MKNIIEVNNISKVYNIRQKKVRYLSVRDSIENTFKNFFNPSKKEDFWALKDVSFEVEKGSSIGIIGKNGAGKSTLLKIISKITPPTSGSIKGFGRTASLLEVGTGFHPELTGRENIYFNGSILGLKKREIDDKFDDIVEFSGTQYFLDTPLKHFSSGMRLRLAFSVAAFLDPEVLIIDEVLAVGDAEFQKKCLGKMETISKQEGRTILFVSHDLNSVEELCDRVIILDNGSIEYIGEVKEGIKKYKIGSNDITKKNYASGDIVEYAEVIVDIKLRILVKYNFKNPPLIPHFGFIISDMNGRKIIGSNPTIAKVVRSKTYTSSGVVEVSIDTPTFLYGTYRLSIWMGDGIENRFVDRDCLSFTIPSVHTLNHKVGYIKPNCKFNFY